MIDSTEIQVGTLLNDRYRLDAEIGRGGLGVVYRAHDALLGRDVAVKVLSASALSAESRARLLREAQAAAQLNHPNIVSIYDVGGAPPGAGPAAGSERDSGPAVPFIVMELVEGASLHERRPKTLAEIFSIAGQVCAALAHAHAHGIIHRDLKPENILLASDGLKLVDFGLAHTAASRTMPEGAIVGTVFYLAPEQASGGEIDGRADLYALGVILYELVAGRLPFTGDDPLAVISQHLHAQVVPPSAHDAAIPPLLDALIVRLLSKKPEDRPASANEVRQTLEDLLSAARSEPPGGQRESMPASARASGQGIPLLATKLYIPPLRSELVPRPRLIERLNAGLRSGRKLTLLSAPAGFGKTTLLSEWVVGCGRPVAWVSLDRDDNDPTRFWAYVLAALRTIPDLRESGVGESALSMLRSPQPPPIETLLTGLINDIAEMAFPPLTADGGPSPVPDVSAQPRPGHDLAVGRSFILALDDLHVITNSQVNEALAFTLDNLPPQMQLVIATRSDPLLPLSRLRGRGQLTELSAADLRFTPDEAATFLNQVMGLGLSAEDVAALETRTEGWIVGLQMAAHALQGALSTKGRDAAHISDFISAFTGSHRYILDYLTDEVLSREPEEVQAFLLQTSILDRLSGPLCDAVTGQEDGQEMLERLDAANLFIVPLDDGRHWYRYHHLFAELLSKRLNRMHAHLVPTLHCRASEWYEGASLIEGAITHAFAGQDYPRAARLVEQNAMQQMMTYRREATLARWLEALPYELVQERPWLCVYLAWTRYWMGLREQVEECLQHAEEALARAPLPPADREQSAQGPGGTDARWIAGYIAAIRAHHALTNQQLGRVIEMAQRAIEFLPDDDYMRCEAAVALGGAYWGQGDVVASQQAFAQARATAQKSGYRLMAVPSSCYMGMQQAKQGQLHEAWATYRQSLEWAIGPGGRPMPVAGFPLIRLGDLSREWNDLPAANRDLTQGIELCVQLGQADVLAEGYVLLARLQLAQGDAESVLDTLGKAEQIAQRVKIDPWITAWADECRLQLWLSTGNRTAAVRWARMSGLSVDGELSYHYDLHHINLVRVLIARGMADPQQPDLGEALRLLDRLSVAAERAGWVHEQIKILILRALALEACGDGEGALAALERALALAEPGGYVRIFVDEGLPMARLLRRAAGRDIAPGYVSQLLAALEKEMKEQARTAEPLPLSPAPQAEGLVEPLSEREIEVLELVAQGLTNRQIAQRLFISQGTVKAHTSNIYGKLGVRSRTQAVARARALGIL